MNSRLWFRYWVNPSHISSVSLLAAFNFCQHICIFQQVSFSHDVLNRLQGFNLFPPSSPCLIRIRIHVLVFFVVHCIPTALLHHHCISNGSLSFRLASFNVLLSQQPNIVIESTSMKDLGFGLQRHIGLIKVWVFLVGTTQLENYSTRWQILDRSPKADRIGKMACGFHISQPSDWLFSPASVYVFNTGGKVPLWLQINTTLVKRKGL